MGKGTGGTGKAFQCIRMFVMAFTMLASGVAGSLPFWFNVLVLTSDDSGTSQTNVYLQNLDVGLIYMVRGDGHYTDLVFKQKATNVKMLPPMMQMAQVFFLIGLFTAWICFIASLIFACKRYKSVTGELVLAGASTPMAACLTLGVIFAVLTVFLEKGVPWHSLSVTGLRYGYEQQLLETTPAVSINFGLYIGAASALGGIVACILAWLQACQLCSSTEEFRYSMLRNPRFEQEEPPFTSYKRQGVFPSEMYAPPDPQRGYIIAPPPGNPGFVNGEMDL